MAITYAEDLFDSLDKEKPEIVREPVVSKNERVKPLLEGIEGLFNQYGAGISDSNYNEMVRDCENAYNNAIRGVDLSQSILQEFLFESKQYERQEIFRQMFGVYATNCIKELPEKTVRLDLSHFDVLTENLGLGVGDKKIHVIGNLGPSAFCMMENCTLVVHGDVESCSIGSAINSTIHIHGYTGSAVGGNLERSSLHIDEDTEGWLGEGMRSGVIRVDGDVEENVGLGMKGGEIHVGGNAGQDVGGGMFGGSIYLNGDYVSISRYLSGGNIYHKGKQIVKDGVKL